MAAAAVLIPLMFTVPSTSDLMVETEDGPAGLCAPGLPTEDVAWVRVYRMPITGGRWVCLDSLNVRGREGTEDTIWVDPGPGAHFYTTVVDTAGNESCASDLVYWGPITGVAGSTPRSGATVRYFNIHGQVVKTPTTSGIYFWAAFDERGRLVKRGKMMVLR